MLLFFEEEKIAERTTRIASFCCGADSEDRFGSSVG